MLTVDALDQHARTRRFRSEVTEELCFSTHWKVW
jgi:hypothetical protein